eukprot:5116405-Ditylum_brightwellii.AAC.1
MPLSNWRPMIDSINLVGILLVSLNDQLQANMISQLIHLSHANLNQERKKRWILHCLSKVSHWAAIALASANKMAKTIVLNPTRSYAMDNPGDLVQINNAQTLIRAMHQ